MAIQAPAHAEGFGLGDFHHLVDPAMAGGAADAPVDMGTVGKKGIVRDLVDTDPLDGSIIPVTLPDEFQLFTLGLDQGVTIHAGLGGGNDGFSRLLH